MTEVKRGMMKFYHRGLLSKKWKEYKFILYESSLLTWYADVKHKKPDGMVLLKDVEQYICVGPYTRFLPDFPQLENEYDQIALIAFPQSIKDRERDIIWLLCDNVEDLNSWMRAIVQTLPSHTLPMRRMHNISSSTLDETVESVSEVNSPVTGGANGVILESDSVGLPIAAGLLATRLQGHTMDSKGNPLKKAGYDFGNTQWGTGAGWGYLPPEEVPGFAAIGGSGYYADLVRTEEEEQRLRESEACVNEIANDDESVEQATYELSKNEIDDDDEGEGNSIHEQENVDDENENVNDDEDQGEVEEIEDEMQMIDSDIEIEP